MIRISILMNKYFQNKLVFLADIENQLNVDKTAKFNYNTNIVSQHSIPKELVYNFLLSLNDNEIYLVDTILSKDGKYSNAYISLSRQFIITKDSSDIMISNYLNEQLENFEWDFEINLNIVYKLIFKYKKILITQRKM